MFCPSCGGNIPDQSRFCPNCSANLAQQAPTGPPPGAAYPPSQQGYEPPQQGYGPPPQQGYGPPPQGYAPAPAAGGLTENVAGLLAYITIIPAIIFLVMEPYKRSPFIRFHAWQCIFMCIAMTVINFGLGFSASMFHSMAFIALMPLLQLVFFIAWVMCLIKAYGNEKFKLPIIGDIAEQQAMKG